MKKKKCITQEDTKVNENPCNTSQWVGLYNLIKKWRLASGFMSIAMTQNELEIYLKPHFKIFTERDMIILVGPPSKVCPRQENVNILD